MVIFCDKLTIEENYAWKINENGRGNLFEHQLLSPIQPFIFSYLLSTLFSI